MTYGKDLEKSEVVSNSEWLRKSYEKKFGSKIKQQEKISGYEDKRKYNYDKRLVFDNGKEVPIEEKIRFKSITDFLVETHHEYPDGRRKPGWLINSKADVIAYISAVDKNMVLIDLRKLKVFAQSEYFERLRAVRARNPKEDYLPLRYYTINKVLPWNLVTDNNLSFNPAKNNKRDANMKLDMWSD